MTDPTSTRTGDPAAAWLGSVVVPCLKSDLPGLRRTFRLWSDPRFTPLLSPDAPKPALLVVFNAADEALVEETRALYAEFPDLARSFSGIEVHSAGLEGDRDLYARGAVASAGAYGNKAGPNFLFQAAMHRAAPHGGFTLQAELDCLPLGRDWIAGVDRLLATAAGDAWVIGAPYLGDQPLDPTVRFHINGNALYRCSSPAFLEFLDEVWMKSLLSLTGTVPQLAYDCWWSLQAVRSDSMHDNAAWRLWQQYCFFFLYNPFVINLLGGAGDVLDFHDVWKRLHRQGLRPLFMHGSAMPRLMGLLLDEPQMTIREALEALARDAAPAPPQGPGTGDPIFAMLARLEREAVAAGDPQRVLLGQGIHRVEGPLTDRFPVRHAWTSAEKVVLHVQDADRDLELILRDGRGRDMRELDLSGLGVTRRSEVLPSTAEVLDDPTFLRIRVPAAALDGATALTLHTGQETFEETGGARWLGMLMFEVGLQFGRMRFGLE